MNVLVSGLLVVLLCYWAWAVFTWQSKVTLNSLEGQQGEFSQAPHTEPYRSQCSISPFTTLHSGAAQLKSHNNCQRDFSFHNDSDLIRYSLNTLCIHSLLWCIKSSAPYSQVNCLTSQLFLVSRLWFMRLCFPNMRVFALDRLQLSFNCVVYVLG